MATYTSDVTNPTPLTAAETVSIQSGATVTITDSNWTAAGSGNITVTFGKLLVQNTSTTTGMVFKFTNQANNIDNTSLGRLEVQGNWISIGTGGGGSFTLNGAHTNSVTTITVNEDTTAASTAGQLVIGSEVISYTGKTQYTFTGCTRALGGSIAAAYANGTAVKQSNSGQTATHWSTEYCPVVWVETYQGSGVYEKYQNLIGFMTTHAVNSTSMVGGGNFGRFFTQSGSTITFGDGRNGKCPAPGANIRVPNIIFTHANASVASPYYSVIQGGGEFVFDTVQMAKVRFSVSSCKLFDLTSVGLTGETGFNTVDMATLTDCGNGFNHAATTVNTIYAYYVKTLNINNCSFYIEGGGSIRTIYNYSLFGAMYITDSFIMQWDNATSSNYYYMYAWCNYLEITDTILIGPGNMSSLTYKLDGLVLAANPKQIENQTKLLLSFGDMVSAEINDIRIPWGCGSAAYPFHIASNKCNGVKITNVTIDSTYHTGFLSLNGGAYKNFLISDCYINDYSTGKLLYVNGWQGGENVVLQNITSNDYVTAIDGLIDTQIKNVACGSLSVTQYRRSIFHQIMTGTTTGELALRFGVPSEWATDYVTYTGKAVSNASGQLYMPALNDQAVFVYPYKLLGITSFQNVAPTVSGTNTANFTLEYAIDTGSGYGSWTALTAANLSAETVDEVAGFNIKFRITCNSADANNNLTGITIPTNIDQSVKYPMALVTITLQNVITGSRYRVEKESDGSLIAEGTASSSTVTINNIPFSGDTAVKVKVRKASADPKYFPFETGGTITSSGLTTYVSQVEDTIAAA